MSALKLFLAVIGAATITRVVSVSQNVTYQDGASGSAATLLSIGSIQQSGVFGDDNELLRRIAYTETRDGTLSNTFRAGYHGGIWAVDEQDFLRTKNTTRYTRLPAKFQQIQLRFGTNWLNVQWRELRKPLYSALAARLVLYIAPLTIPSADDLPAQAQFWVTHYNTDGDATAFVTTSSGLQGSVLESSANEFFLGFSINVNPTYADFIQLFVSTPENSPVTFAVSATGHSSTETATNHSTTVVSLPLSLQVADNTQRNKGIYVKAEGDRKIVVYGLSYQLYTTDAFLALPCSNLAVDTYTYYGVAYPWAAAPQYTSDILLVGCEDQTVVTTPDTTITLNRLETYLISALDTTGLKVTSTKPLSFFSNHKCTNVPEGFAACDFLTEQIPPTLTWGREFFVASLQGRTSGELYRVIASEDSTTVRVLCSSFSQTNVYNLASAGNWREFRISSINFCSVEASAPVLLVQFALGFVIDQVGDPFMMMIPPVEQYANNYVLNVLSAFSTNFITIYVAARYYQPHRIFVDNQNQQGAVWSPVRCVDSSICGYITRVSLAAGEHHLYHQDSDARVGVSAYGFNRANSYGYSGGLKLTPIQLATVSFDAASYTVLERQSSLSVNITRSGNLQNASVVLVASNNFHGTASAREDYTSISEIVEFMPGQTQQHVTVQIHDDIRLEGNETFELYLIAGAGVSLTPISRTEITIQNDDGMVTLSPSYGCMLGGTGVVVTGEDLVVNQADVIVCTFDDVEVRGVLIGSQRVLCVSPLLERTGKVDFMLNVSGINSGESVFNSLSYTKSYGVDIDNTDLLFSNGTIVNVRWSPFSVFSLELPHTYRVDITFLELNLTSETWTESTLASSLPNTGFAALTIPAVEESSTLEEIVSPIVIKVSLSNGSGSTVLLTSLTQFGLKPSQTAPVRYLRRGDTLTMQALCTNWSLRQSTNIGQAILNLLPPCPLRLRDVVAINSGYFLETFASISPIAGDIPARTGNLVCGAITSNSSNIVVDDKHKQYFHPDISDCYRLRRTDLGGHSQQCCYNNAGFLSTGPPGGGNVDLFAPDLQLVRHFLEDLIPYLLCCKAERFSKCNTFYQQRPSDRGFDFSPPRPPARARTDPHMVTFDGHKYTFNGRGEFVLVETPNDSFTLQGRMLPITTAQNTTSRGTVYKAVVGKQNDSDTVQFEIVEGCGFIALVNGEQVIFGLINQQEFNKVVVSYLGNNTFSASFASGAYVEAKEELGMIAELTVSLPPSFEGSGTRGLMGSFNRNVSDDLLPNNVQQPISINSSTGVIHEQFGITWIVDSPLDSLFTYQPGQSWSTFYNPYFTPDFRPVFSSPALEQQANATCGGDVQCLFDIAATGNVEIGEVSVEIERENEELEQKQVAIVCQSSCGFGACVANNTCHCEAGYTGSNCSTPIFTTCDENPCQFGGTCVSHRGDYICTCPPATSGDFCEIDLDIDECTLGVDQCHSVATCTNTRGSYFCTCPPGSSGDGFNCIDLCNECTGLPMNCGNHNCNATTSDCTNTIGSFQCTCRFGLASDELSCLPPPVPESPTSVSIVFTGATVITLTWVEPSQMNNISSYNLLLFESGGSNITISVPSGTTSYNFTGLEEYRDYSCVIIAVSIYGPSSVATIPVTTQTLQASPSAPPENFNTVSVSPTSASITWEPPPADDVNGVVILYIINVTVVGSGETFLLNSTTTSLNVTILQPYRTYICVIAAVTSIGTGPFSVQLVLQTPQAPPASSPRNITLSSVSSTSINLAWSPPISDDINGVITVYHILITEVLTGTVFNFTSTTTSFIVPGLHPYYVYDCIISAFTVGNGPYSQAVRITTPEDVPSGNPVNFGGNATTSRSAVISWDPPAADQWNGVIILYIINVTVLETGETFQLNSTSTSLTVSTLQPYRNYVCIVAALTSVGSGPFSTSFTLTTPQDIPTRSPQNASATIRDSRTIECSWSPPPFDHQNGLIIEYRINVTEVITGAISFHASSSTTLVVGSLHPDYVYEWTVTAVTIGVGPFTSVFTIRTPEDVPTATPLRPEANATSSDSVRISWQPPPLADQNGVITGYVINLTSLETGATQQLSSISTTLLVSSLNPFTVYSCIIAARTAVGLGPFTGFITFRTFEAAPDSHPSNFTGLSLNSTHIHLTWDTPPPSEINGIIREYRLNVTEDATGNLFQYTTNATVQEITIGPFHPYYIYHCSVVAFTVEPGPYTSVFSIQTEEDVPSGPPTNFVVTAVDPRTVNLTWSPPSPEHHNGILRYYLVHLSSILPAEIRNLSSLQHSVTITNLRPNTLYSCTVSVGTVGLGPPTEIRQVLTPEDAPTGPPQNFSIAINDSRSLILDWSTPLPQDVNGIVTDYTIVVTSSIGNTSFQTGSNDTFFTLSSLRPYVVYTCTIAAHTSIGLGPFTISVTVTTPEDAPEAPPVMITHNNVMSRSAGLSWSVPRIDRQNGVIRHYIIEAYVNDTGNTLSYQTPSDQTSFVISNLHPYYTYSVRIRAVTVSPGPLSISLTVNTMEDVPTAAPLTPSGYPLTSSLIRITWSPPPAEHINGIIDSYLVEMTEVVTNNTFVFYSTQTHINAGPLHPYYMYRCRVRASTIGPGPYTDFFNVQSGEAVPTGAPLQLTAPQVTTNSLTLSWDPPQFDRQNGLIRHYVIYITDLRSGASWEVNVNDTRALIPNLQPFVTYNCSVAAVTIGVGPISESFVIRLPQDAPSAPPINLRGFAPDHSSISLEWDPPSSLHLNGILTQYIISVTEQETGRTLQYNTTNSSILLDSLHPHYVYECRVAAHTVETGPFSTIFAVQVLMAAPSGTPENLTAAAISSTAVEVSWDLPLPHFRNGPITAYNLIVTEQLTGIHVRSIVVSNTSFEVDSLRPFTTYNFALTARNSIGYGPSVSVSLLTPEDVPLSPTDVTVSAVPGDPLSLYVIWRPPVFPNGYITHYSVYCGESEMSSGSGSGDTLYLPMSGSQTIYTITVQGQEMNATVTGFMPFTNYGCYVTANTSVGEGSASSAVFQTTDEYIPMDSPTNVQVSVLNATSVYLTWSPPLIPYGHILTYTILVEAALIGRNVTIVANSSDGTNNIVTNLLPFTHYNFSVAASTRIGRGPFVAISTTTPQDSPYGSPANLTTSNVESTGASINWTPPDPNLQNGVIFYYSVMLTDLTFGQPRQVHNTTLDSFSFTGLEEYALYSCEVAAGTAAGLGPFSMPVLFTTLEDVPSAAPQNLSGSAVSSTVIVLSWSPPPPTEINGAVRHYTVKVLERHTSIQWTFVVVDTSLNVGGLHPYYHYDFNVSLTTIGPGPFSTNFTVQTQPESPIAPPQHFTVLGKNSTSLTLSWSPPPFEDTNGQIQYYIVLVTELDTNTSLAPVTALSAQVTVDNLHPYYSYLCAVAAYTVDVGPYTAPITTQLDQEAPTAAPVSLVGSALNSDSITLSWSPPATSDLNGVVQHYLINVTEVDTGHVYGHVSLRTNFTLFSLHAYYTYSIMITAVTLSPGPPSNPIIIRTEQEAPSGPAQDVSVSVLSHEEVVVSWRAPNSSDHNGVITSYDINITVVNSGQSFTRTSTNTSLVLSGLLPFTSYTCHVAARTEVGLGPFSTSVSFLTDQTAPSNAPENVSISILSSTSLEIRWIPPPPPSRNGIITEYRITVSETDTGTRQFYVAYTTSLVVQSLHPHYTYLVNVSAHTVETGPYSAVQIIQTPQDVPSGFPQSFVGSVQSSRSISFSWLPLLPHEQNGVVISYTINITETSTGLTLQRTVSSSQVSIAVDTLLPFTMYSCSIAASTSIGVGPFSTLLPINTPADAPDASPSNLTSVSLDPETICLVWDEPTGRHNGIIQEYRLNITELETGRQFRNVTITTTLVLTNLHPDYTYLWTVTAFTIAEGPYSTSDSVTTLEDVPSGPPTNFSGSSLNSSSISLSWDLPAPDQRNGDITGYVINVTNLDNETVHQYVTSAVSVLTVTNLIPFTLYEVQVFARTSVGVGQSPAIVLVITDEDAPGSHPLNSSGYAINSTHIALNWSAIPEEDLNGVLREYRINVTEGLTGTQQQFTTAHDTTEIVVGSLHPFYIYHCTITAYTVEGGPTTNVISIRTHEDAPSGPPTDVTAIATSPRSIRLSWSPPVQDQQNGLLRYYLVTLRSASGILVRNISSFQQSISLSGLRPHTLYNCTVQAETVGLGPPNDIISVTTPQDIPSGSPQNVVASAVDPTTLRISWDPPVAERLNGMVQAYSISITEIETGESQMFSTANESIVIPNRHPYYRYRYLVAAVTTGQGPFSVATLIRMPEAAPSSPPSSVQITVVSTTGFLVSWTAPPTTSHNGIVRSYIINITEENTGRVIVLTSHVNSQRVDSLHPYYNYTCVVAAVTVSAGPFSDSLTLTTDESVPTGPPTNLTTVPISSSAILLSWDEPLPSERNGVIISYTINLFVEQNSTTFTTSDMSLAVNNLVAFTSYSFNISASTRVGTGPVSGAITETTLEEAPGGAPLGVSSANVLSTSLTLSWRPPLTPNGMVRYYIVTMLETNTGVNFTYQSHSHTSFSIGDLHPFYTYQFYVRAVTVEVGPLSTAHTVTTLEDVPSGPPINVAESAVDAWTLLVQWAPPGIEFQNGVITGYVVRISAQEAGEGLQHMVTGNMTSLEGLHPDYTYTYTVAARTSIGIGSFSMPRSIRMPEAVPTGAPLNTSASPINSSAIIISWELPSPEERNGNITEYSVILREVATNTTTSYSQSGAHIELLIVSLHPYYEYECQIAAETAVGRGPYGDPVVTRTLPDVPTGAPVSVRTVAVMSTSVEVTWDTVSTEHQNGPILRYIVMVTVIQTQLSFTISSTSMDVLIPDLHPSYDYSIEVAAVTTGTGPYSTALMVRTSDDAPSGPPVGVSAASIGSTSIRISWQAPALEQQNGVITSYHISIIELESGQLFTFTTVPTDSIYVVNDLHPFYHYNCSVTAFTNGLGPSAYSTVQTAPEAPSQAPNNVSVSTVNVSATLVSWLPPSLEHRNGIIGSYTLSIVGVYTDEDWTISTNSTHITVGNLRPFYSYQFSVAATTISIGPYSTPTTFQMPSSVPRSSVRNVTTQISSPTSARLRWLPGDVETWNGVITRYTVQYSLLHQVSSADLVIDEQARTSHLAASQFRNDPNPILATSPLEWEEIEIDGLRPYFVYSVSVFYENSAGQSANSSHLEFSLPYSVPTGPPTEVSVMSLSQTSILVRWSLPHLPHRNGPIVGYDILLTYNNGSSRVYTISTGDIFTLQLEGLPQFVNISITTAARTPAGLGPSSLPLFVNTTPTEILGAPTAVGSSIVDKVNVNLAWSHPNDPNGLLLEYNVIYFGYKQDGTNKVVKRDDEIDVLDGPYSVTVPATMNMYLVKNLQPGLTYSIIVQARTVTGFEVNSTSITVVITVDFIATDSVESIGQSTNTVPIVLAVLGWMFLMVVIIVLVAAILMWRRKKRSGSKNIRSESTSYGLENRVFTEVEKEAGVEMDPTTCDVFRNAMASDAEGQDDEIKVPFEDENEITHL